MNTSKPHLGGSVSVLKIHAPEQEHERPTAVEIKVVCRDRPENNNLPALWSRPRCRQETLKTVAPAPRQSERIYS